MKPIKKIVILALLLTFWACGDDNNYQPRPKGYFRIELPKKSYTQYSGNCPFRFEYPAYAKIVENPNGYCWLNIEFPQQKATIYLSYSPVYNNLDTLLEDSRTLVYKHVIKAIDIPQKNIIDTTRKVYATTYEILGNTASQYQFQITDSIHHFLRGSLYFNTVPNGDSLKPVVNFLKADIEHLLNTITWQTLPSDK